MKKLLSVLLALLLLVGCGDEFATKMNGEYNITKSIMYIQGESFDLTSDTNIDIEITDGKTIKYSNDQVGENYGELVEGEVNGDVKEFLVNWTDCNDNFVCVDYDTHIEYNKATGVLTLWWSTDNASTPTGSNEIGVYVEFTK